MAVMRQHPGCATLRSLQIALRVAEPGLETQGLLELLDRFVQLSLRAERDAQVVVRFGVVGPLSNDRAKHPHRIVDASVLQQQGAEIVSRLRIGGIDLERPLKMGTAPR